MEQEKIKIALVGYGAMGKVIESVAEEQNAVIVEKFDIDTPIDKNAKYDFDVAIDFTHPQSVIANIEMLALLGKPMVIGTTGWYDKIDYVKNLIQEANGKLLYASNFSVGVQLFFKIVRNAARLFNSQEMYDVGLHEFHHLRKADSPSGTALSLAGIVLDEISRKEEIFTESSHDKIEASQLHVTSTRVGSVPGTHSVFFDSSFDTIELKHTARNRTGFAVGSVIAAKWLKDKPSGVYLFDNIF